MEHMEILYNKSMLKHNVGSDTEGPYRIEKLSSLVADSKPSVDGEKFLTLVHKYSYLEKIKTNCEKGIRMGGVATNIDTYSSACLAVGLAIDAANNGDFAAIRPPGHHATNIKEMGYCFFNNMAIAVTHLLDEGNRVLVMDFDGHHGNGTQEILVQQKNKDNVLYFSITQEDSWPHTVKAPTIVAIDGSVMAINMLIPKKGGDDVLAETMKLARSAAESFKPDVIGCSAGFDGYKEDKLLELQYTERGFYEIGRILNSLGKKVFGVLEGGYHNKVVECIQNFVLGVEGKDCEFNDVSSISEPDVRCNFDKNIKMIRNSMPSRST